MHLIYPIIPSEAGQSGGMLAEVKIRGSGVAKTTKQEKEEEEEILQKK